MKIKNGLVFTGEHTMEKKELCFEDGIITDASFGGELDAEGCYVLPGFIDTHIHGAFGVEFYTSENAGELRPALDGLTRAGITSVLVTFATEGLEKYIADTERVLRTNDDRIVGIHCEGPFVNMKRKGGLDPRDVKLPDASIQLLIDRISGGMLKIVTLAPELEGVYELIQELTGRGIKVSLGHSDASADEARGAVDRGASRMTHTYNAMRPFSHRDPGVLGLALTDDRVCCELICDMHHVSPEAVKLAVRAKGVDGITMVSDSSFFAGLPEGDYGRNGRLLHVEGGYARLPDGTICGSACTLADGAKNMFALGYSPADIAVMACVNPARAAGASDRGELLSGYRADVIVLDSSFNVKHVFLKGKQMV